MAKNKRGRKYRMTPRRKAALRKAQIASARKRRGHHRRRAVIAGGIVAVTLGGAAATGTHVYVRALKGGPKRPVSKELVHVPRPRINLDVGKDTDRRIREFDKAAKRASIRSRDLKTRAKRNQRKRMKYWQGRPVSGGNRIPAISTAGSRKAGAKRRKR